jgi:DNA polymerase elongation subunit (family B)
MGLNFYTNIFMRGNKLYVRANNLGIRTKEVIEYKPYLFVQNKDGNYKTLDGTSVDKIEFSSISDAKDFVESYKDVSNFNIYGYTNYAYLYLYDAYRGDIQYDPSLVNIATLDIECAADEGFPSIDLADKELTAITIRQKGRSYVFGCGEFVTNDPNIFYVQCKDEFELIKEFIDSWERLDIDIVTGWNIEFFDIPYLINRIKRVTSEKDAKRLSPWGIINPTSVIIREKEVKSYQIHGITVLDYLNLYRKLTFTNHESYSLNYISGLELGEKKIDYSEHGSLLELYKNDFQKFIEYNIKDCILVDRLEDKLKFIELTMAMAYDAKVSYSDTLTTVRMWDNIIHNYLMDKNTVIPMITKQSKERQIAGGYVKDPQVGVHKWVVSLDLNSLYPHLILQYNISPETLRDQITQLGSSDGLEKILNGEVDNYIDVLKENNLAVTATGYTFTRDFQGFLPALMQKIYDDRVVYKNRMIEAKKRYEVDKTLENEKAISQNHNYQLTKKITLNSAYGALSNEHFRWFDNRLAESITLSGQLSTKWIERKMNNYLNKLLKTKDIDYVIACDTDSMYIKLDSLVEKYFDKDSSPTDIVKFLDRVCEEKLEPFIDKSYQELADYVNAYDQKMKMKREAIADKGIWVAKKRYILNVWNNEGVQYQEPKLKISGIEAVRSSTPEACRKAIKEALHIIMQGSEESFHIFISNFKESYYKMNYQSIAFPRGVKGLIEYSDPVTTFKKATPIHVRGSLVFNKMLKKYKLNNIPPIADGDKIRFCYLKMPNPTAGNVISTADGLPDEFKLDSYIDYDTMWQKSFIEPVSNITNAIGWKPEKINDLTEFFG